MDETDLQAPSENQEQEQDQEPQQQQQPKVPETPVEPITSRFLFVDVAAMRAKQLRRGALPRLGASEDGTPHRQEPHKPERIAMEEVRRGLVPYEVPELPRSGKEI